MRQLALALGLLLVPVAPLSQSHSDSFRIKVRHLALVGAIQISAPEQRRIADEIENLAVTVDSVAAISDRLQYALQERGYFKAAALPPEVKVVSSSASEEVVELTYHVDVGRQYRLKEITFANNAHTKNGIAFPASELRQSFPIKDGEIFDVDKIRIGLAELRELYADNGYLNFTPVPNTYADDRRDSISLDIDLDEGPVFRIGALLLEGVEPVRGVGVKLLEAWKPYEGQIYNQQLLDKYIRENASNLSWNTEPRLLMSVEGQEHIVTFVLEFKDSDGTN